MATEVGILQNPGVDKIFDGVEEDVKTGLLLLLPSFACVVQLSRADLLN